MAPSPSCFTLQVRLPSGERVSVVCTRKRVKNLNLRVRATGEVALSIPLHTSRTTAQEFLDSRAGWIEQHMRRAQYAAQDQEAPIASAGAGAGTIALWGERADAATALRLSPVELASLSPTEQRRCIDALYRQEVSAALAAVYGPLEARMGVHAARWQVRIMKTRWGSCTPKTGSIRINGALAAYPPACLEAVVAHELVHLLEPSHNERFHALLDEYCPCNREAMARLRRPPTVSGL